jgi:Dyp-type peroxidase family
MSDQQQSPADATPDLHAIQGDLIGFNKDHQRLVFLHFSEQDSGRAFIGALEPNVASGFEVRAFNDLYKRIRVKRQGERGIIQASWTNIALTFSGLQKLGAGGLDAFPEEFRAGMAARAGDLGDVGPSEPSRWLAPFTAGAERQVEAMVILAADDPGDLQASYQRLQQKIAQHNVLELGTQDGSVRPDDAKGHEHFGFKDGISQPGIHGLTTSSKNPTKTIEPGEFLIGYRDEAGHVSGQPEDAPPTPQPGDAEYGRPPLPPPLPAPMPDWTVDGSFLVYRRLRQDVVAFHAFASAEAGNLGLAPERLEAKLVGRWASGAPMEPVPGLPATVDPSTADPSQNGHPEVLDDPRINRFGYGGDPDGDRVPRAAHIRKSNPRNQVPPGLAGSDRHRILRRGIPYGPEVATSEPAYGTEPVSDDRDRGLLFLCYQASIARGFAFIQQIWVNNAGFPQADDGHDPIISQELEPRQFHLPPHDGHVDMKQWVFTTGGDYFFSPSIPALKKLAAGEAT